MPTIKEQIQAKINTQVHYRDRIRSKLNKMSQSGVTLSDNTEKLADGIEKITIHLGREHLVTEGQTKPIPAGYHDGTGYFRGVTDTEGDTTTRYKLYSREDYTPDETGDTVSAPEGYYGLAPFKINPIPSEYKNLSPLINSDTSATPILVAEGYSFIGKAGSIETGSAKVNGDNADVVLGPITATSHTINPNTIYIRGFDVKINVDNVHNVATPTTAKQTLTPTLNQVWTSFEVNPIPDDYVLGSEILSMLDAL
jgi:hypothetical protein